MKSVLTTLLTGASFALLLAGTVSAQTKVVIGHFGDPAPYKAAVADGRLEKATGWTIEWRKFNSGAEVNAAMASGGIVISEIGSVPLSAGASTGVDYQLVSIGKSIVTSESLITRNGAGIEKPADLKGKKVAVPIGSTAHFSLMGALKTFGLTEKDVQIIGMSPPEIAAAWSQNAIDAAFVWNPVQAKLRENGKALTTAGEVAKAGFPTFNGWVVNTKFGAENRAGVVNFLRVMNEVNGQYTKNKAAWTADSPQIKAIAANVGSTPQDAVAALDGASYPDGDAQMLPAWMGGGAATTMKATADFLKSAGRINTVADNYSKFVNADFAKAAAAK
ncbi:ABC transporter substrate-binding protein [Ramlibacter sp. PS3R-8]|uniref:taurine ABC transporter substrate-binding protein n=1 Tax=Ramlibacter sp. PS3R-8 TaxID=3133437 RepID=UPI00309E7A46